MKHDHDHGTNKHGTNKHETNKHGTNKHGTNKHETNKDEHHNKPGIFEICATGHGSCEKCVQADPYQRCYYCFKSNICAPFIINGFLGPDKDCPLVDQRVATCAISINAIFTPLFLTCFALIGIGLIVVIGLAIRNHCRERRQSAKMVKTHHIKSTTGAGSNGTMWDELKAEAMKRKEKYQGYAIDSSRSSKQTEFSNDSTVKTTRTQKVQWTTDTKKDSHGSPKSLSHNTFFQPKLRGRSSTPHGNSSVNKAGGGGGEMQFEKPVGKSGITTIESFKGISQGISESTVGSTPTPGASSECSLTERTKPVVVAKNRTNARSPALKRNSKQC